MRLSIIIPTLQEASTIAAALKQWSGEPAVELIVSDGGSTDDTVALARAHGATVLTSPRGRGTQQDAGARIAAGDVLLFLHADVTVPPHALAALHTALADPAVVGGTFQLAFAGTTRAVAFMNRLYPLLQRLGLTYGDAGIFIRAKTYRQIGGFPPLPLFEDLSLWRALRHTGTTVRAQATLTASARRFEHRFARTLCLWVVLQLLFWLGVPAHHLARAYAVLR